MSRSRTVICTPLCPLGYSHPNYRRGPFIDEIAARYERAMRAVCADFETVPVEFNGERDYVELQAH
ncbi:hypothetical protein ACWGBU_40795 [Streptomyces vinaceus]